MPEAVPAASQATEQSSPEKVTAPKSDSATAAAHSVTESMPSATDQTTTNDAANLIRKAVDDLLAAKSGREKHEMFAELRKNGQLDAAIAELNRRAADNPKDAGLSTTLGEALLNKVRQLRESGDVDNNEMGILAMQADQRFNAALKLDPQNWEAQFVKASSMYYWPANAERDADVVQRLSTLIDQQDSMPAQPEFAQTYVVLGDQYRKVGQPEKAVVTWQLGLQKFPGDPQLLKRISGK